jgi:hypothetical protein
VLPVVAGRHRLEYLVRPELDPSAWAATDEATEQRVLACLVSREVGAAAQMRRSLEHVALVPLLDVVPRADLGDALADADRRGAMLVITEALRGESLEEIIRRTGPADPVSAVRVVLMVGGALAAMHAVGSFHGGVTPLAIEVVDDTCPRLGVAGIQDLAIGYQSPGRFSAEGLSAHDDAWSLLACLYYAMSGVPPFQAETPGALARRVLGGRPLPLRAASPAEDDLQKLFDRGFSRSESRRYPDIATLAGDLRSWLAKHAPGTELPPEAALPLPSDAPSRAPSVSELPPSAPPSTPAPASAIPASAAPASAAPASAAPASATPAAPILPAPAVAARVEPASEPAATPPSPTAAESPRSVALSSPSGIEAPAAAYTVPPAAPEPPVQGEPDAPAARASAPEEVGVRPTLPASRAAERAPDRRPVFAVAALGIAVVVGVAALRPRGAPASPDREPTATAATTATPPARTPPAPSALAPAASPTEAPASPTAPRPLTSASPLSAAELDVCVGGWFPRETFDLDTDLGFVCSERDARKGNAKLRRAILAGGKNKKVTDAMYEWGRFGWFELPLYATLREKCCPGAPPVEMAKVVGSTCAPPHEAVQALATVTAQGGDVGPPIRVFRKAVSCLVEVGDFPAYGQPGPIGLTEEPAFRAFAARGQRP